MSNLDMYCIFHFDNKSIFAHMGELGLRLDQKDFTTNSYAVDEEQHLKTISKAGGRKEKAVVPTSEEEENVVACSTSQSANDDPLNNLSNNNDDSLAGGSKAPLTKVHLISSFVNVEALVWRKNVITPSSLFIYKPIVQRADLLPSRLAVETRRAKKAR